MNKKILFHLMGMSQKDYILKFALPLVTISIVFSFVISFVAPDIIVGSVKMIVYAIPLIMLVVGVMYPITVYQNKKASIDNNMHYYITHLGVLSTSQMPRKDLLQAVSKMESYEALADETGKVYMLMNDWNLSLAQACRFIARRTPADPLGCLGTAILAIKN